MKNANLPKTLFWVICLVILLGSESCQKEEAKPIPSVEGNWKITAYKIDPATDILGNGQKITDLLIYYRAFLDEEAVKCLTKLNVTFNQSGKITVKPEDNCTLFNSPLRDGSDWKLDGSKLTISDKKGSKTYESTVDLYTLKLAKVEKDDFDGDGKEEAVMFILELTRF